MPSESPFGPSSPSYTQFLVSVLLCTFAPKTAIHVPKQAQTGVRGCAAGCCSAPTLSKNDPAPVGNVQGAYLGLFWVCFELLAPLKAELLSFRGPFGPALGRFGHKWPILGLTSVKNDFPPKRSWTLWEGKRGILSPFYARFDWSANRQARVKVRS